MPVAAVARVTSAAVTNDVPLSVTVVPAPAAVTTDVPLSVTAVPVPVAVTTVVQVYSADESTTMVRSVGVYNFWQTAACSVIDLTVLPL